MKWIEADWPAPERVRALTTLREGGFSEGCFAGLNLARHVNDSEDHVLANRVQLKHVLALPSEPVWLRQVHGCQVVEADRVSDTPQADAAYTTRLGVVCAVMTADCLPVLVTSLDGECVAAIHAGWRGLLVGVIEAALHRLKRRDLLVWLGPAIGPACFEVGDEVRHAFVTRSVEFAHAFVRKDEKKWLFDIYAAARLILARAAVYNVYGGDFCTVTDETSFFSYRRDGDTGRMASLIWRA